MRKTASQIRRLVNAVAPRSNLGRVPTPMDAGSLRSSIRLLLLLVVAGCSRPEPKNDTADHAPDMPLFAHPGGCRQCHDGLVQNVPAAAPPEKVCSTPACHASFREVPRYVHGPVALADCSICHAPHTSTERRLLTLPEPELCGFCHPRLLSCPAADRSPADCTSCHDAHGGEVPHLLRPRVEEETASYWERWRPSMRRPRMSSGKRRQPLPRLES